MRFSIDTNILVYATVNQHVGKHRAAVRIMERAPNLDCVVTLQTLGELFRTLHGKLKFSVGQATTVVHRWRSAMPVTVADEACLVDAMDAVAGHRLSFWDAMLWATAKHAGCRLLLTEDGQDGRLLGGVTLVNPFASPRAPLLVQALRPAR
jgi:predicted nucleic acid-binding protein